MLRNFSGAVGTKTNQIFKMDFLQWNLIINYTLVDIFSRFIVGYEVWETEKAEYAEV